ncbi:hypothetical protein AV530_009187 [Patagioenas fasciata monilis]|uniref:Uncharacterized protein n=1 Tax=Patagioenas fasciata monilis TaxID=372326 RepID=A0A1V4KFX8_PATFA|nr:hypothetical protein AV530_009187 [Patagioenas fasciata monilis]
MGQPHSPAPHLQVLLGIFFHAHSAVLIDDVPFTEDDFKDGPERIYRLYEQVGTNCFIAAAFYAVLGGFSFCQNRLNKRKEYMSGARRCGAGWVIKGAAPP